MGNLGAEQSMSPEVNSGVTHRCFVIMPFGNKDEYDGGAEEARFVYNEIIAPAVKIALGDEALLHCEMTSVGTGAITTSIIRQIAEADVCIVDITGANANVFFELGMRYALCKKATILVKQQRTVIPFDVTNYRCIVYSPFVREKAIGKIAEAITDAISSSEKLTDSPVYEVYPNLVVVNTDATAKSPLLPWELYWERIVSIASLLAEAGVEGRYNPNAILGISNGGGAFLDFLVRKMNFDGPVACLWANRRHADPDHPDYINNPINRGLIEGVKKAINTSPDETRILIVDDLVASGTTSGMAIRFLRNQFVGCHLRFLPLVCRDVIMNKEIDKILIGGTAASITIKSASTAFTWSKRAGFPTIRTYRHIWDSYQR